MIKKLKISGVHTTITDELKKYIFRKIGKVDRYMPRHARESAHAEILIKETKAKARRLHTCEVILNLPGEAFTIKETTLNPFAAVDIVEAKLKTHLKKYKEKHNTQRLHRRVLARLHRRTGA